MTLHHTVATTPLVAALLSAACSLAPPPELPDAAAEMPTEFAASSEAGVYEPLEWWRAFGDPVLDEVVETVLESNLDMAAAVSRVEQARERARMAKAAIRPVVLANGGVVGFDTPTNAGLGAQVEELGLGELAPDFALPDRLGLTTLSLGVDFAWESDFWGRASSEALAAGSLYLASASDYHAARMGVLAETIGAYFEIADLKRQTELTREMVAVLQDREEAAATRYDRGLSNSLDLYRVRQDLRSTQADLTRLQNGLANAGARMTVLLGGYREDVAAILDAAAPPQATGEPIPAGIPTDLLSQRPDVMAARHRLDAARHAIDARRAALLPSLSLSGSIGLQSSRIDELFDVDQWFTNLAANLLGPLFDGGRLRSNLSLAEARLGEAAAVYGRTIVTAVSEVEAALTVMENERRRRGLLRSRLEEAQATVALRSQRYQAGIGGYPDYLDALRTELAVASALASAERDLALARLTVHRALGGAWTGPTGPTGPTADPAAEGAETR